MSSEFLSICIPTWNRSQFLRDLLEAFARQVEADKLGPADVGFYISDNASTDKTPDVFQEFAQKVPNASYFRNETNIGGDPNQLKVRTYAKGRYVWEVGDDELLADRALANLVKALREHQPGLVISFSPNYESALPRPQIFEDYRAFARECLRVNPHALAEHTLISANIYRADCFDFAYAGECIGKSCYSHMYAVLRPTLRSHASVMLPTFPIIILRDARAVVTGGKWVDDLDANWVRYFEWLREEMAMPELDPHAASEFARRALIRRLWRHPFQMLRNNHRALFQPSAWRFVFNRLFRRR